MEKNNWQFNQRAFVSDVLVLSMIGLSLTGVMNHIYGFSPLTVERHAWMSAHNALAFLGAIFTIWHLVLNRHFLWNQINRGLMHLPILRREALLAGALVGILLLVFVGHAFHAGGAMTTNPYPVYHGR